MRILIVEDEKTLREQLVGQLERTGYRVDASADGDDGLYRAEEFDYDAAIVDLGLPGLSGLEIIKRLRASGSHLPILVLTARSRWQDKVEGLEAGADDYLAKPFQFEELLARLRALLRRATGATNQTIAIGPLRLDLDAAKAWVGERAVELTTYEYRLLEYLVVNRSRVLSKQQLSDVLYAEDDERDSNVVEVLIARLRRKLDPDGTLRPIETQRGRGYRFRLEDGGS